MIESVWLPGLVVLGFGLAAGLLLAARLWRRQKGPEDGPLQADLGLRLDDLEQRRDDLYGRLRESNHGRLTSAERRTLEIEAARVLRDIDLVGRKMAQVGGESPKTSPGQPESPAEGEVRVELDEATDKSAVVVTNSRGKLIGFASGIAVASLIGILIYFAGRDAGPRPGTEGADQASQEQPPHPATEGLSTADEAQLDALLARVLSDPSDLLRRKELALFQLSRSLFVEAFDHSKAILLQSPSDPDGLYIQGVVRITMGQYDEAINLLDQVLANYPNHIQALLYRGIGLLQRGDQTQAIDTWEVALDLAGGSHPDIEYLLANATSEFGEIPDSNRGSGRESTSKATPESPQRAAVELQQEGYQLQIEYAGETQVAPNASLFVFLKSEDSGPPIAVRRISSPRFPLAVTLGAGDTMIEGTSLPSTGTLFARLDADGSASTKDENDLEAHVAATLNRPTTLVLRR